MRIINISTVRELFHPGKIVATPAALAAIAENVSDEPMPCASIDFKLAVATLLVRHTSGDWGNVCESDALLNDEAVKNGSRILSAYTLKDQTRVWIITEADRSSTTILLPEEY